MPSKCLIAGVLVASVALWLAGGLGAPAVAALLAVLLALVVLRELLTGREDSRRRVLLEDARRSRDRFLVELVNSQERSSRKIADLLHDDVVQQLTALGFRLELEAQKNELPRLSELAHDTGKITASIRQLLVELHPAILDSQGLAPAIDVVAEGLRERGIDVRVSPFPHRLPRETETLVYRLVQEALANVLRHSEAQNAEVELRLKDGVLRGRVSDTGTGAGADGHGAEGIGLLVARERVELAGGRFLVDAKHREGTDFLFELPLADERADEEVAS